MVSLKFIFISALSATAVSAKIKLDVSAISSAIGPYATYPGIADLLSLYAYYSTIPNFNLFQNDLTNSLLDYALSADVPTAIPTATNPAQLMNDPVFKKISGEIAGIVTQYIATETYLDRKVKMELATDLVKIEERLEKLARETGVPEKKTTAAGLGGGTSTLADEGEKEGSEGGGGRREGWGVRVMAGVAAGVVGVVYTL